MTSKFQALNYDMGRVDPRHSSGFTFRVNIPRWCATRISVLATASSIREGSQVTQTEARDTFAIYFPNLIMFHRAKQFSSISQEPKHFASSAPLLRFIYEDPVLAGRSFECPSKICRPSRLFLGLPFVTPNFVVVQISFQDVRPWPNHISPNQTNKIICTISIRKGSIPASTSPGPAS